VRQKKLFYVNGNQTTAEVAICIADKIEFKSKTVTRDKEGHYIMIKGPIHKKNITVLSTYMPNIEEKYIDDT
jgi:hypothetical protein